MPIKPKYFDKKWSDTRGSSGAGLRGAVRLQHIESALI